MKPGDRPTVTTEHDPLSPKAEVYWIERPDGFDRVSANRESVEDGEASWRKARITSYKRLVRTLLQSMFGSQAEGVLRHPEGFEVEKAGPTREGFIVTSEAGKDIHDEVRRRLSDLVADITTLSASKVLIEGAEPAKMHQQETPATPVPHAPTVTAPIPFATGSNADSVFVAPSNPSVVPVNAELSVKQTEAIYRHAFEQLPHIVAKQSGVLDPRNAELLLELDRFRKERVRWASVMHDGALMAQESGTIGNAWIYVVPPNHWLEKQQHATLSAHMDDAGLNHVLSILSHDIHPTWAALAAAHELSHLRDGVLGIEPTKGRTRDQYLEGEHRAYSVERALALAMSGGRLQSALETIVTDTLRRPDPAIAINDLLNNRRLFIMQSLDPCLVPDAPRSPSEEGTRLGLYVMLLGFEFSGRFVRGGGMRRREAEKRFIESMYEPLGVLPPR